jgi:ribosomal protein S27E
LSLKVSGRISMQDTDCIKCDNLIRLFARSDTIRCDNCGATYNFVDSTNGDQHIEFMYEFVEFRCVLGGMEKCHNPCPAPSMFCKEHVSDESFKRTNSELQYAEKRIGEVKEKIRRMEESKKVWIIQKLSGIDNEQDDTISKD